jgi:FlaG/FlaF family flagellin (archaellin)
MVAITVILAAVIGAFVLEIGDQQETAPNTSFDSEEQPVTYPQGSSTNQANPFIWNRVTFAHAGGDVVDFNQVTAKVNGNGSVYNAEDVMDDDGNGWHYDDQDNIEIHPTTPLSTPTVSAQGLECTVGQTCEWTSGQTVHAMFYGKVSYETAFSNGAGDSDSVQAGPAWTNFGANANYTSARFNCGPGCGKTIPNLQSGDSVRLVWSAQSGGKTSTLFKYSVQGGR